MIRTMTKVAKKSIKNAGQNRAQTVTQNVRSEAIQKLSDIKLSDEQLQLKNNVFQFIENKISKFDGRNTSMYVIEGDAGTGKSVILNALFNDLQKQSLPTSTNEVLRNTKNYLVVNHPEMLKLYY